MAAVSNSTLKWDSSGLKELRRINNLAVRQAYAKKVEAYARRNNIRIITAKVINGIRE
ncbi:MAG: hypothetical protein NT091_03955 [Candidatus Falkowbacteria bacterium]|nr:hypothetical protein [Candidatus Falkowbacteria bacterium]